MSCELTKDDCAEIYRTLGYAHAANLQARIGYDGEKLRSVRSICSSAMPRSSTGH